LLLKLLRHPWHCLISLPNRIRMLKTIVRPTPRQYPMQAAMGQAIKHNIRWNKAELQTITSTKTLQSVSIKTSKTSAFYKGVLFDSDLKSKNVFLILLLLNLLGMNPKIKKFLLKKTYAIPFPNTHSFISHL